MHALARITSYMSFSKKIILLNAFFKSQFSQSPLVSLAHFKQYSKYTYERCLHIMHNYKQPTFYKLLEKAKSVSIHSRNLKTLAVEVFKVAKGIVPFIFTNVFNTRNNMYCTFDIFQTLP